MSGDKATSVVLRPKRQITLPRHICDQLGIEPGDMLELTMDGSTLMARPKRAAALEALKEVREAFKRSGITEAELLDTGRKVRQQLVKQRHADKA